MLLESGLPSSFWASSKDNPKHCNRASTEEKREDPATAKEALSGPSKDKWKESMIEEIQNLVRNDTWDFVKLPKGKRLIKSKWIFKTKYDDEGDIVRLKSRLVALGYSQKPGLDYHQTYAPVVQKKTMRILFAISVERNWQVHHVDIQAAYLMAEPEDEAYMEIPD